MCHSGGGFPEPAVDWLINDSEEPPEGSVRTLAASLPDSHLYNITSHLTINIPKDSSVSCIIKNLSMNETFASTSCERLTAAHSLYQAPNAHRLSTNLWSLLVLRWSAGQPSGDPSIRWRLDVQHGSLCGGWAHGAGRNRLSDSPGQNK